MSVQDITQALGGRWFGRCGVTLCPAHATNGSQDKAGTVSEPHNKENASLTKGNAATSAIVNGVKATQEVSQLRGKHSQSRTVSATTFYFCKATNSVERLCGGVAV